MSEVACSNCVAACCMANTAMRLTAEELAFMEKAGTAITEIEPPPNPEPVNDSIADLLKFSGIVVVSHRPIPKGIYLLEEDCRYLETSGAFPQCRVYEDPDRPQVCQKFRVGSTACLEVRLLRDIDSPAA